MTARRIAKPNRPVWMRADQAEAALELWASKRFDTLEIARLVAVHGSMVVRTIHAARDLRRAMEGRG